MVFSFFGKGKGQKDPRTITPPRPVVSQGATDRSQPEPAPAPPPSPPTEEEDWDDLLLTSAATAESHSAVEEAAVLYANDRVPEAIAALETFLKENAASRDIQPWLLLFDLYQYQGMKQQFDELSLEFVVRFERSAPVWEPLSVVPQPQAVPRSRAAGGAPAVLLKGRVGAAAEESIGRLKKLAEGDTPPRLDVSAVEGIDAAQAQRLADVLLSIRKTGKSLALAGGREFTALVRALTAGEGRSEPAFWRLLFELYAFQNMEREFEDAAVDYAVTFEVSPPSWEPMAGVVTEVAPEAVHESAAGAAQDTADVFRLEGILDATTEHRLKELERYAQERSEVRVDLSGLIRVDFMVIGSVIGTLINLSQAGKKVTLSGQNEMIQALFEVMGVRDFATLVRRKPR